MGGTRRYRSFVALGDSFTEGLHDDLGPDGRHLGWADRVAASLAVRQQEPVRFANLAIRGRLLDQVVREQVPQALAWQPDLISFHAGPNDVLRPGTDLPGLFARYERAVAELREAAEGDVLLFTVIGRTGGTGRFADFLAGRFAAFSRNVVEVAARHDCRVVDMGSAPALTDRRLWDEDRLHLAPAGHARIAAAVLETLEVPEADLLGGPAGWWREPLAVPEARRGARVKDAVADVRWARTYLAPWVGRRLRGVSSGDALGPKHAELVEIRPPE